MTGHDPLLGRLQQAFVALLLLVAADLAFAAIHLIHTLTAALADPRYSLAHDLGYPEIFQYVKMFWIVLLLAAMWWRSRQPVYGAWTVLYAYLLLDDALQFHELGGAALAEMLGYTSGFGLRDVDFGELTVSAGVGALIFTTIFFGYLRSTPDACSASQDLFLLLATLVGFGVGVDVLHAAAGAGALGILLGLVEDGGEMLAISVTVWYMLGLHACRGEIAQPLWRSAWSTWRLRASGSAGLQSDGLVGRPIAARSPVDGQHSPG